MADLVFIGSNNSYLVKRKSGGGAQFSRDPLNLINKHSRKVRALRVSGHCHSYEHPAKT